MSVNTTNLWVGYDLGNLYSQISCYNERRASVDSIALPGRKNASEIPTQLCKNKESGQWIFGEEAVPDKGGDWIFFDNFLSDYESEPEICVGGETFSKKELLFTFVKLSLELLKRYYPHGQIQWLTFTAKSFSKTMMSDLLELGKILNIAPGCVKLQNHVASYANYALCQPRELWARDVGLFEYDDEGLCYYHLTIHRKRSPMVIETAALPLSAYLSGEDYKEMAPPQLDRKFVDVIREVLGKRSISTIYLAGRGFESDWLNVSKNQLCSGRKCFFGQNLYSSGACYNSMLEATGGKNRNFIVLSDEMVPVSICLDVHQNRKNFRQCLMKAGSDWYSATEGVEFILEDTDIVPLYVQDFAANTERVIPLRLENLPKRPNRTTRILLRLEFEDSKICCVVMEDLGFGSMFPATGKTWKMRLNVVEYESVKDYVPQGRLLLCKPLWQPTPYYFKVSGLKVHSVEELCYYIYENIFAVNLQTFDEDLFYWLETEMKEPLLVSGLKNVLKSPGTLRELVRYLLTYVDYYSPKECQELMDIMDELARQNPTEAKKMEADNYVRYCRYMQAIRVYNDVIYDMEHGSADDVTREFRGNTWHNLGVAYTRVLNYKAALECFKKAWHFNQKEDSLKCYLWLAKLQDDETGFFDAVENSSLEEADVERLLAEYAQVEADAISAKNDKIAALHQLFREEAEDKDHERLTAWLDELKAWYRE